MPFDIDAFLSKIKDLLKEKKSIIVAVSEGIKLPDGRYVCELSGGGDYVDAFGHKQLQGTATYLANFLAAECGCKTRAVELSTLQRSASHMASRVDINEAFMVIQGGGAAVKAADEGDSGKMVVIDRVSDDPTQYYEDGRQINDEIMAQIMEAITKMEGITGKKFGDKENPLLVSVRSGARASMPGMMDTILNLGLNEEVVETLSQASGNPRLGLGLLGRRFIQMYSDVVMEVGKKYFEELIDKMKAGERCNTGRRPEC